MIGFDKNQVKWGKYLAKGSFGKVYEVEYKGQKYAGKKISDQILRLNSMEEALRREVDILEKMSKCDNSVKFYAHYKEHNNEVIILELCDCELGQVLDKTPGGFNSAQICSIMKGLNNAFSTMNINNIIHRDIKLANVMVKYINQSHTKFIPKVNDYGLSKQIKDITGTKCGTPIYMAPEIFIKNQYDRRADLWSIGVMMYYMCFKDYPYDIKENMFRLPKNQVINIFNKKKKKDANDKLLDDLLNKLLTYDPDKRITWNEYLIHPFFNKGRELKKRIQTLAIKEDNYVIKMKDSTLEEMVLQSFEKELKCKDLINNSPNTLISIDECLDSKDDEFYILGVVGQYLEDMGITCIIEKDNKPKNYVENDYNKNIMQLISNGYIWKNKYLLDFELGFDRIAQLVQEISERSKFHEKLRNALIKAYNLSEDELIITNYKRDKKQYRAVVVFKSNFNKNMTKNELLQKFNYDNELKTLKYIEKKFIIPSIKLSRTMLYPKANFKNNKYGRNDTRGAERYNPPIGWYKYGLNVSKRFDKGNDNWLGCQHKGGEWAVAYAPFTGIDTNIPQDFKDEVNDKKPVEKVGVGLYCPSKPELMEERTETIKIKGINYKIGFMMRVKPEKIRKPKCNKDMWILSGDEDEVRPYCRTI